MSCEEELDEICPRVDIVLATFNGERFVNEQIVSIQAQTHSNWKLFVLDDGSTDATIDCISSLAASDPRITIVRRTPVGSSTTTFIEGLRLTDARYVLFADQDDVWHPNKIEIGLRALREEETSQRRPALIATDARLVRESLELMADSFLNHMKLSAGVITLNNALVQGSALGCSMIVNRPLVNLATTSSVNLQHIRWHDWWLVLVAATFGKARILDQPTLDYRQHDNNQIGAGKSRRSPLRIWRTARRSAFANYVQARELYGCFSDSADSEPLELISDFLTANKASLWRSIRLMIRRRFFKGRVIHDAVNIVLIGTVHPGR